MQVSFDQLKETIVDNLPDTAGKEHLITAEASLTKDLGADSLDAVELILAIEEEYGVEIPDEIAENMKTVGDIMSYLEGVK